MPQVINPEKIIRNYLLTQVIKPNEQEGRKPTGDELHDSIITAAAIILLNLDDFDDYCFESEYGETGSDIKVVSQVASAIDEGYKSAHLDFNYRKALIYKQIDMLKRAEEIGVPIQNLIKQYNG